jgi:phage shock protein A
VSKLSDSLADLKATVDQEVIDHQTTIDALKQQLADAQAAAGEAPTQADFDLIQEIKTQIAALDPRDPTVLTTPAAPTDQPAA